MDTQLLIEGNGAQLRTPEQAAELDGYHRLRRRVLFAPRKNSPPYDPCHPDEREDGHYPLALFLDGGIVGTIRIDMLDDDTAAFRLLAIAPERQRRGHGGVLLTLAEEFVRRLGRNRVRLHGAPGAVPFYLKHGYRKIEWNEPARDANSVNLGKSL